MHKSPSPLAEAGGPALRAVDLSRLVTYRVSGLAPAIRMAGDTVVMVTRETDRYEAKTLLEMCRPQPCTAVSPDIFGDLQATEAALLPGVEEAHGQVRRFQLAPD